MASSRTQRGLTFVEVMFTLAVLSVVMLTVANTFLGSADTHRYLLAQDLLKEQARKAAERVVNTLRASGWTAVQDVPQGPDTTPSMRFRQVTGYDGSMVPIWGPEQRLFHQRGSLYWESNGSRRMWCPNVKEVVFSREGNSLLMNLRCETVGPKGERINISRRTYVTLQN